MKNFDFLSK